MIRILHILLLLLPFSGMTQITYEPIFIEQCTGNRVNRSYWHLSDSNGSYGDRFFVRDNKFAKLPSSGQYWLYLEHGMELIEINVPDEKHVLDTILLPRLEFAQCICPYSEYLDCGISAEGFIIDYYNNGKIRMKGTFEKGQPVDSLFTFYHDGSISELFIPSRKGSKRISYFENGQEKLIYDLTNKFEKEFFESGRLKREEYWDSKYHRNIKEYAKNGQIILDQTKKKQEKFSVEGQLTSVIKRKEVLILDRIFSKNKWDRFYEYDWQIFDSNEVITRKMIFSGSTSSLTDFPESFKDISDYLFDEVIFYRDGKPDQKIEIDYLKKDGKYTKYLILKRMINDEWSEGVETEFNSVDLYELIETLSSSH